MTLILAVVPKWPQSLIDSVVEFETVACSDEMLVPMGCRTSVVTVAGIETRNAVR